MANRVFISFRYIDGKDYKDELVDLFRNDCDVINCSESKNRLGESEATIRRYLYDKLRHTSVTIVLLTPKAVNHEKLYGSYDDWMHDEIRFSLEDRPNNRPNGLIAVYTPEAAEEIIVKSSCHDCSENCPIISINHFDNLVRHNMMNVKDEYKRNRCRGKFDAKWDSYCSLVSWDEFKSGYNDYIKAAYDKREIIEHYDIKKNLNQ